MRRSTLLKILPWAVGGILWLHGAFYGITDDEAYYWVLSRNLDWGYAFHPPAVAWVIRFFEVLLSPLSGILSREAITRFPAAVISGFLVYGLIYWYRRLGLNSRQTWRAISIVVSFAAIFGVSWMMVPDLPLLLGWIGLFLATWQIITATQSLQARRAIVFLGVASFWVVISKLSSIFLLLAVGAGLLAWCPRRWLPKAFLSLFCGALLGFIPFLIWNALNHWGPILYQIRDRHATWGVSWLRYVRFWIIIFAVAGPSLTLYLFKAIRRGFEIPAYRRVDWMNLRVRRYLVLWILPAAAVFCVQPLISDFKPHWAAMVWLPVAVGLGYEFAKGRDRRWAKIHRIHGCLLMAVVLLACHIPLVPMILKKITNREIGPGIDVTNDAFGWKDLPEHLKKQEDTSLQSLPVIGSRYQTGAQASYALWKKSENSGKVARVPRSIAELKEWPQLSAVASVESQGAEWPKLLEPVLYVADLRYNEGPKFPHAQCQALPTLEAYREIPFSREKILAKKIMLWKCIPN